MFWFFFTQAYMSTSRSIGCNMRCVSSKICNKTWTVLHPTLQPEGLRLRIIGRLKTLTKLDGVPVGDEETAAALRMAAGSRISQVSLLMHSRTDTEPLRTLSLQTQAHTLAMYSNKKPDRAVDLDNNWYLKVRLGQE